MGAAHGGSIRGKALIGADFIAGAHDCHIPTGAKDVTYPQILSTMAI